MKKDGIMNIFTKNIENECISVVLLFKEDNECLSPIFKGDAKEIYTVIENNKKIIYAGLGEKKSFSLEVLRNVMAKVAKTAKNYDVTNVKINYVDCDKNEDEMIQAIAVGIDLGLYEFLKYKTDSKASKELNFYVANTSKDYSDLIEKTLNVTSGIRFARDLSNEPSNVIYPETLAKRAREACQSAGLDVTVLAGDDLSEMGGILAVGNGSVHKPRLIIIRHLPCKDDKNILGIVGKGLTCDTGGYSLKTTEGMYYQKTDMSGAANAIAIMLALAKNNVQQNVVTVIPSCENVLSAYSYKVGDVIKTLAGKTIEVLNTDAEGRIALADALHYAKTHENVTQIIDIATLTGSVGIIFGNIYTGAISNNDVFFEEFMTIAKEQEEKFWRLPLDEDYKEMLKSDVADIKNVGKPSTITAGMFLKEFIGDIPWIHLDIAATAVKNPPIAEYEFKGGTGIAIRTIYNMVANR